MKFKIIIQIIILLVVPSILTAHNLIKGNVVEKGQSIVPIPGASIYFPTQSTGTQSDSLGNFSIDVHANYHSKW